MQTAWGNARRKAARQLSVLSTPVKIQHTYTGLSSMLEYVFTVYDGYLYSTLLMFCCTLFFLLNLFTAFLSSSLFYVYFHVFIVLVYSKTLFHFISFWPTYFSFPVHLFYVPLPTFLCDCQPRSLFFFLYHSHTFPSAPTLKIEAACFSITLVAINQSRLHVVTPRKIVIFTVTANFS